MAGSPMVFHLSTTTRGKQNPLPDLGRQVGANAAEERNREVGVGELKIAQLVLSIYVTPCC